MIELYSGTPGSGKSLHMAKIIKEHINRGRPCIGNFQINYDSIKPNFFTKKKGEYVCVDFDELTPDTLISMSNRIFSKMGRMKEDYILLFIDESQIYFNSREWNSKSRKDWLKFFTLHRHYGYHIVLVAQFDRMLDRQIRALLEYECVHRKAINFGLTGFFLNLLALGGLHVAVTSRYTTKLKLRSKFFKCKKSLYSLYDTFALFGDSGELGVSGPQCEQESPREASENTGERGNPLLDNTNT